MGGALCRGAGRARARVAGGRVPHHIGSTAVQASAKPTIAFRRAAGESTSRPATRAWPSCPMTAEVSVDAPQPGMPRFTSLRDGRCIVSACTSSTKGISRSNCCSACATTWNADAGHVTARSRRCSPGPTGMTISATCGQGRGRRACRGSPTGSTLNASIAGEEAS